MICTLPGLPGEMKRGIVIGGICMETSPRIGGINCLSNTPDSLNYGVSHKTYSRTQITGIKAPGYVEEPAQVLNKKS